MLCCIDPNKHQSAPAVVFLCVSGCDQRLMRPFSTTANRARLPLICGPYMPTLIYPPSENTKPSFMSLLTLFTYLSVFLTSSSKTGLAGQTNNVILHVVVTVPVSIKIHHFKIFFFFFC